MCSPSLTTFFFFTSPSVLYLSTHLLNDDDLPPGILDLRVVHTYICIQQTCGLYKVGVPDSIGDDAKSDPCRSEAKRRIHIVSLLFN
jgi:hypothetical protein